MNDWLCLGCFTKNNVDNCYCIKCKKISCNNFCWYCEKCKIENETINCICGEKYQGHNQQINIPRPQRTLNNPIRNIFESAIPINNESETNFNIRMEIRMPENSEIQNVESFIASILNPQDENNTNESNNNEIIINSNIQEEEDSESDNITNVNNVSDSDNDNNVSTSDNENWRCEICNETNSNESPICSLCRSLPSSNVESAEWLCTICGTLENGQRCSSCGSLSYVTYRESITRHRINRILRFINNTIQTAEMKDIEFRITKEELNSIPMIEYNEEHRKIDSSCPICMEEFKEKDPAYIMDKCCNKIIHKECLEMWFQKKYKCPLCRHEFKHEMIK